MTMTRRVAKMQNKLIVCDSETCSAEFTMKHISIQTEVLEGASLLGIHRSFFCCPVCGKEYTIEITDSDLRMKIARFRSMYKAQELMVKQRKSEKALRKHAAQTNELRESIIVRGMELKRVWG